MPTRLPFCNVEDITNILTRDRSSAAIQNGTRVRFQELSQATNFAIAHALRNSDGSAKSDRIVRCPVVKNEAARQQTLEEVFSYSVPTVRAFSPNIIHQA
jgi:hypothetical protein